MDAVHGSLAYPTVCRLAELPLPLMDSPGLHWQAARVVGPWFKRHASRTHTSADADIQAPPRASGVALEYARARDLNRRHGRGATRTVR